METQDLDYLYRLYEDANPEVSPEVSPEVEFLGYDEDGMSILSGVEL